MAASDELTDAVTSLLGDLLAALEALDWAGRRLHPPAIGRVVDALTPLEAPLRASAERIAALEWPQHLSEDGERLERAAAVTMVALHDFCHAGGGGLLGDPAGMLPYYRALRRRTGALEALYPLCGVLVPVSRYFLEEPVRTSTPLLERLAAPPRAGTGLIDLGNDRSARGGLTLYVPEVYDEGREWPLVVALHGGSGHGADFVWSWLREARSRGLLLASPTARGDTWSMLAPAVDGDALAAMVERIADRWWVDRSKVLLTGMSDGGTFSLIAGLRDGAPFTHLAPMCGVLPPMGEAARRNAGGRPVFLVHGALDWMFPVALARMARDELGRQGAEVTYREIADLSHTYPREINAEVADWLGAPLRA